MVSSQETKACVERCEMNMMNIKLKSSTSRTLEHGDLSAHLESDKATSTGQKEPVYIQHIQVRVRMRECA